MNPMLLPGKISMDSQLMTEAPDAESAEDDSEVVHTVDGVFLQHSGLWQLWQAEFFEECVVFGCGVADLAVEGG